MIKPTITHYKSGDKDVIRFVSGTTVLEEAVKTVAMSDCTGPRQTMRTRNCFVCNRRRNAAEKENFEKNYKSIISEVHKNEIEFIY